jgi:small subunit ribosomal protein S20|tara:strand:+ start:390 stop:656 length:267 start_codon:yes stop_codon:yes gene_type:complete
MPQHKSAKKRLRQSEKKRALNKSFKSNVNTEIKNIEKLITDKKLEESIVKLKTVMSLIHKSAKKKIINLNKASRTIAKMQKSISAISK